MRTGWWSAYWEYMCSLGDGTSWQLHDFRGDGILSRCASFLVLWGDCYCLAIARTRQLYQRDYFELGSPSRKPALYWSGLDPLSRLGCLREKCRLLKHARCWPVFQQDIWGTFVLFGMIWMALVVWCPDGNTPSGILFEAWFSLYMDDLLLPSGLSVQGIVLRPGWLVLLTGEESHSHGAHHPFPGPYSLILFNFYHCHHILS